MQLGGKARYNNRKLNSRKSSEDGKYLDVKNKPLGRQFISVSSSLNTTMDKVRDLANSSQTKFLSAQKSRDQ